MLRLWRDEVYAGLFGRVGCLDTGRIGKPLTLTSVRVDVDPVEMLEQLLDSAEVPHKPRTRLVVALTDRACPVIALPWCPNVRTVEEKEAYARAHFEQSSIAIDESHLVHAEFRHFDAKGVAYAVPASLLTALGTVAAKRNLILDNVMPVAAVAYGAARLSPSGSMNLTLLIEQSSARALLVDGSGLTHLDAEPTFGGLDAAARRLLLRLHCEGRRYSHVELWAPFECGAGFEAAIKQLTEHSTLEVLEPGHWRRHQ